MTNVDVNHEFDRQIELQTLSLAQDMLLYNRLTETEKLEMGAVLLRSVIKAREEWLFAAMSIKTVICSPAA